jgi:hypothetical protein
VEEPEFDKEDAEMLFEQISDDRVFEGEDEEKFEKLIGDMTDWMNKYAGLYDDPDTILEDLELPKEEPASSPIVGSTITESEEQPVTMQYATEIYIEYQYPG